MDKTWLEQPAPESESSIKPLKPPSSPGTPITPWAVWKELLFANNMVRRNAKRLFFRELAVCLKHGMPMDEALRGLFQTKGKPKGMEFLKRKYSRRVNIYFIVTIVAFFIFYYSTILLFPDASGKTEDIWSGFFGNGVGFLANATLILISFTPVAFVALFSGGDHGLLRVARIISSSLHQYIIAGIPLSEALRKRWKGLVTKQEIEALRRAEENGSLPETLMQLAGANEMNFAVEDALTKRLIHPLLTLTVFYIVGTFLLLNIFPKLWDIQDQMGSPRHPDYGSLPEWLSIFIPAAVILYLYLTRWILNGSRAVLWVVGMTTFIDIAILYFGQEKEPFYITLQFFQFGGITDDILGLVVLLLTLILIACLVPYLVKFAEFLTIKLDKFVSWVWSVMPFTGRWRKFVDTKNWMHSMANSVRGAMPIPLAVENSRAIVSGRLSRKLRSVQALTEKGVPLGRACQNVKLFSRYINGRLEGIDGSVAYAEAFDDLRREVDIDSNYRMKSFIKVLSILTPIVIGLIAFSITYSIYSVLFGFVHSIGFELR